MTGTFIHGDPVSCSRVGGIMRRESSRLRHHAHSLDVAYGELWAREGPVADSAKAPTARRAVLNAIAASLTALRAAANDLDQAGAAVQRYATDLAEAHELGRRALLRVEAAGLLVDGTQVIEPWGPASAEEAERRRAQAPRVQAEVAQATAHVGRARGRLRREATLLAEGFSEHTRAVRPALADPCPHADPVCRLLG